MKQNIPVLQEITAANTMLADTLRATFDSHGILVLNMIASPGAGKTTLLERTIALARGRLRIAVIEGDPTSSLDGERIGAVGAPAVQINTGGGCHLEARMVRQALDSLTLSACDVVVIENVGNLLCPTGWDLGEDLRVVVASLPEGDDKPVKYPMAFASAHAAVINKVDLAPHIPSKTTIMRQNALAVNADLAVFEVSCLTDEGLPVWIDWLATQLKAKRDRASYA